MIKEKFLEHEEVIEKIAHVIRKKYSSHELAWFFNQNFATNNELLSYVGDDLFEIKKAG